MNYHFYSYMTFNTFKLGYLKFLRMPSHDQIVTNL